LQRIPAGQLPHGASGVEQVFDAAVLTARKHGVTGRAQLAQINGLDPTLQQVLCADYIFPSWLRALVAEVEASDRRVIGVVCSHGQHRSVACAELLKQLFYPHALVKHLTMHNFT
jgi:rhodanese-related sulfurtransferase